MKQVQKKPLINCFWVNERSHFHMNIIIYNVYSYFVVENPFFKQNMNCFFSAKSVSNCLGGHQCALFNEYGMEYNFFADVYRDHEAACGLISLKRCTGRHRIDNMAIWTEIHIRFINDEL